MGASAVLCIGASRGTGPAPPAHIPAVNLGALPADSVMGGIRQSEALLDALPAPALAQLEQFDPEQGAGVIRAFFSAGHPVGGRRCYGRRLPEWQALEDKLQATELWRAAGIAHAPTRNVPTRLPALERAFAQLDRGDGCVLAGDNSRGWHGGAALTRWARSASDLPTICAQLTPCADSVRVMPFLAGVPCSVHGVVLGDPREPIATFRPAEMLVFRTQHDPRAEFLYASAATSWDPSPNDRDQMRHAARKVGECLRARFAYRGAFTLDGVLTAEGFLPTELNPRFGAALAQMERALPYSLSLLNYAVIEGALPNLSAQQLESEVLASADQVRACSASIALLGARPERSGKLSLDPDGTSRWSRPGEAPACSAEIGPAPMGALLRLTFDHAQLVAGAALAPVVSRAVAFLERPWQLGLGSLTPCDVPRR